MKIFLSYASGDRSLVEPVLFALRAQKHEVFFDRSDLPPGEDFHARIREAIEASDLFIFFVSPDSVGADKYTLSELEIAQKNWPHPASSRPSAGPAASGASSSTNPQTSSAVSGTLKITPSRRASPARPGSL